MSDEGNLEQSGPVVEEQAKEHGIETPASIVSEGGGVAAGIVVVAEEAGEEVAGDIVSEIVGDIIAGLFDT